MRMIRFFFQAEDGIRDIGVTGVQTCALPISGRRPGGELRRYAQRTAHHPRARFRTAFKQIGRASCRERVENSELRGALKKKNHGADEARQMQGLSSGRDELKRSGEYRSDS